MHALLERVTPTRTLEELFCSVSEHKNDSRGPSGAPWEAPCGSTGTLLAANLALLAPSWVLFGGFLAALGWLGLALGDA